MKSFLVALFALIAGALIGVFVYTRFVPPPLDVLARAAAFEGDRDYFFQNTSELFPTRTVARSSVSQPMARDEAALDGFTYQHAGQTKTLADIFTDMETSGLMVLHNGRIVHESYARGADAAVHDLVFG